MDCVCVRCGIGKPRTAFAGRWGTSPSCRECYPAWRREDDLRRWHANPERVRRQTDRQRERYRADPAFADARRRKGHKYRLAHPERVAAKKREWARANPDKVRAAVERYQRRERVKVFASVTLRKAVEKGIVPKLPCAVCRSLDTEAHHHNGYAPEHILDVVWLCRVHHKEQHRIYPR